MLKKKVKLHIYLLLVLFLASPILFCVVADSLCILCSTRPTNDHIFIMTIS